MENLIKKNGMSSGISCDECAVTGQVRGSVVAILTRLSVMMSTMALAIDLTLKFSYSKSV
jgi:hypothetical protein